MKFEEAVRQAIFERKKITRKGLNQFYTGSFCLFINDQHEVHQMKLEDVLSDNWEIMSD